MVSPIISASGIAYPDDLTLLKHVYDRVCAERGFRPGSPEGASLAAAAMQLFAAGVFDEQTLCLRLRSS